MHMLLSLKVDRSMRMLLWGRELPCLSVSLYLSLFLSLMGGINMPFQRGKDCFSSYWWNVVVMPEA